jgi:RNA polymerase sigma factor (sigma-70 family)
MPDSRIQSSSPSAAPAGKQSRAHAWYEAYGQAVYSYVRFHVASADEADDVTAETFLKVLAAEERFDPDRGEARVWIFHIAQNTLRDHHRRSRVRRHTSLGAMRDLVADAPTAEERLLWEEEGEPVALRRGRTGRAGPGDSSGSATGAEWIRRLWHRYLGFASRQCGPGFGARLAACAFCSRTTHRDHPAR